MSWPSQTAAAERALLRVVSLERSAQQLVADLEELHSTLILAMSARYCIPSLPPSPMTPGNPASPPPS